MPFTTSPTPMYSQESSSQNLSDGSQIGHWQQDGTLGEVVTELKKHPQSYRCLSFDFFDTLVFRLCPEPKALFLEVGQRLAQEHQLKIPATPQEYRNLRITAERRARVSTSAIEVSIAEIYAQMQPVVIDPRQAAAVELEVEQERCQLNPNMVSLLKYARQQGLQIAILSDIYYSASELAAILEVHNFDLDDIDLLLASSDERTVKGTGGLFQVAMERLQLQPDQILHVGDNWDADCVGASRVGVHAIHYERTTSYQEEVFQRERQLLSSPSSTSVNSLRVLAQRSCAHLVEHQAYFQDGAFLFGPVMARFADWCVEQIQAAGITRVLPLMREGELLGKLLERAAAARDAVLEVRPFYTSRQATILATIVAATPSDLVPFLVRSVPLTTREALTSLGLEPSDLDEAFTDEELNTALTRQQQALLEKLLRCLTQGQPKQTIEIKSQAARQQFVTYLQQQVDDHSKIALVDLGWGGTIQRNILSILRQADYSLSIVGCYLATRVDACHLVLEGADIRAYLGNLGTNGPIANSLLRYPALFESVISACVGSTIAYQTNTNGQIEPVLSPFPADEVECEQKRSLQEGILAFQALWLSVLGDQQGKNQVGITPSMLTELDQANRAIVHRLINFPTRQEAERLGGFHIEDNFGVESWQEICGYDHQQLLRTGGLERLAQQFKVYWLPGVVAKTSPQLVRQLGMGWSDPAALGIQGAWSIHQGDYLPYLSIEKQALETIFGQYQPRTIVFFGHYHPTTSHWLLDQLPDTADESLYPQLVTIVSPTAQQTTLQPESPRHHLIVGEFGSSSLLRQVLDMIMALPKTSPAACIALYLDHTCDRQTIDLILSTIAPRIGEHSLVILSHNRYEPYELTNPDNPYWIGQQWLATVGAAQGFAQIGRPHWLTTLFSVFKKTNQQKTDQLRQPPAGLLANLPLNAINLILFPGWTQPEEILYADLAGVIRSLFVHPQRRYMALLIDTSHFDLEEADAALASVVMDLLMEMDVNPDEGPALCLLPPLSLQDWQVLAPRLHARLAIDYENQDTMNTPPKEETSVDSIPVYTIDHLSSQRWPIAD